MSTFLLSYFPTFLLSLQFVNELLIVSAHGTLDGLVRFQTLQRLLPCAAVGVAEHLCELLYGESEKRHRIAPVPN